MTARQLVLRERRRARRAALAVGAALAVAGAAAAVAVGALALSAGRWLTWPRPVPVAVWLVAAVMATFALRGAMRRVRRDLTTASVAAVIERERALRAGALRGALEVETTGGALGRRAAESAAAELAGGRGAVAPRAAQRDHRRLGLAAGALGSSLATLAMAAGGDGIRAMVHPVSAWRGTLASVLVLEGVPRSVVRGERIEVAVRATGRTRVLISARATGHPWTSRSVAVAADGRARTTLPSVDADVALVATDGRTTSDTALIRVTDRPFLGDVVVRAIYPAYLGRPVEQLAAAERLRLPRGTALDVSGRASTPLRTVALVSGGDTARLTPMGRVFAGRVRLEREGSWQWSAVGASAPIADLPPPIDVEIIADSAPRIAITDPRGDTALLPARRLTVSLEASDDHGIVEVALRSVRRTASGQAMPAVTQRVVGRAPARWRGDVTLDLASRALEPGDELRVVAEVTDDSPWAQRGASRELVVRVPTLDERRATARESADSLAARAVAAASAQNDLTQRTADAARARGDRGGAAREGRSGRHPDRADVAGDDSAVDARSRSSAMTYAQAEHAKQIAQEQRILTERVRDLQRSAAALRDQLREAGALDSALARQLEEAQRFLRDAVTPEMADRLRTLEASSRDLSTEQAHASLAALQAQQQRLKEQLERGAEMLKRAALEGSMQTLRDEAADFARRERSVDSAAGPSIRSDLARGAERLSREMSALGERLRQERERAAEVDDASTQARASADAMRRGAPGDAAQRMQRASDQLAAARSKQVGQWKQELSRELDQSIEEMLQLSRAESAVGDRMRAGTSPRDARGEQAAVQQGVDKTQARLQRAGRKSSLLSARAQRVVAAARETVASATAAMGEERAGTPQTARAAEATRDAAEALNQAAAALVRDREGVTAAKSASGFADMMEALEELAKQQSQVNAQAAGLFGMPGMPSPGGASAVARRLAHRERVLAEQLEELGEGEGGDRAAALAKEARQIAETLDQGRVDATTLARQQQLFKRLLDAGRTLARDEPEDHGKREARAATGDERFTPAGDSGRGAAAKTFREPTWDDLRGLSADERRAVLEYFRRLNTPRD